MIPLLLAGVAAFQLGDIPAYQGVAEDWHEGYVPVGSLSNETAIGDWIRAALQVIGLPGGLALFKGETVTVYTRSGMSKRRDPRYRGAVFAGWIGTEPVLRTPQGVLLRSSSGSRVRSGKMASEASVFQAGRSPFFFTSQIHTPEVWQCGASFGKKPIPWATKRGSIFDQAIMGQDFLVSSEVIDPRRSGELTLFRLGQRPRTLLRRPNARVLIGQVQHSSPLWISVAHYRRPLDHVASSSELSELSPSGRVFRRFSVPFEFHPSGLDDSKTWLLGIRMRGLHAGASELVAIRLKDQAVKTLRSACERYVGLSR